MNRFSTTTIATAALLAAANLTALPAAAADGAQAAEPSAVETDMKTATDDKSMDQTAVEKPVDKTVAIEKSAANARADSTQAADELRTSKIIGAEVYNEASESIGSVEDIVMKADGSVDEIVLSVGGFLGIGDKFVAVPFNDLKISRTEGGVKIVTTGTKEALEALPNYNFYKS